MQSCYCRIRRWTAPACCMAWVLIAAGMLGVTTGLLQTTLVYMVVSGVDVVRPVTQALLRHANDLSSIRGPRRCWLRHMELAFLYQQRQRTTAEDARVAELCQMLLAHRIAHGSDEERLGVSWERLLVQVALASEQVGRKDLQCSAARELVKIPSLSEWGRSVSVRSVAACMPSSS